jgi:hypothetical protein
MDREQASAMFSAVRLFIATPCYGGQVTSDYLQSVVGFTRLAEDIGLKFSLFTSKNESLVTRARNRCVAAMLESDATHLLFLDADIGFDPLAIFQLLARDVPIVCASYPLKGINWAALVGKKFKSVTEMQDAAITHVVHGLEGPDPSTGLVPVREAGTGFMLIKREVVEEMIAANPQWNYEHEEGGEWSAIFDCEIVDGRYLSEDYTFCRRWQRMDGTVWLDPTITLTHTGTYTFGFQ